MYIENLFSLLHWLSSHLPSSHMGLRFVQSNVAYLSTLNMGYKLEKRYSLFYTPFIQVQICSSYFASKARAHIPAAIDTDGLLPVCLVVQRLFKSVVV